LRLDDADGLAEAGALCIIQGKIHEKVSFWIHRGCLLEAAKAAAHSGCHDDQSRFYHGLFLLFSGIARGSCYLHSSPTADGMQGQNKELRKILSVSKKYFRPAVRILKLSKSFKILLIERAVGFFPPHTPPAALSRTSSARFFDSLIL